MTLTEILADEDLRRCEFPVAREKTFLAHAGVCPLPRRVAESVRRHLAAAELDDQEVALSDLLTETRSLAARILNAQPDEIAFVGPTSLALSYVAAGLPWRKGDNILIYFDDYPSNVYPWMALADRGVEVRLLNARELGVIRLRDVLGQVDEQTRLVALASCHFVSGWRVDLQSIGRALRERGTWFCVDAIQTLGATPTTVEHIDFLAADAHKWLLGPCGAGILFVRKALQETLRPVAFGWNNVRCPNYVAQEEMVFRKDAARYEAGTHNIVGLSGLKGALELLLEVGVNAIAAELRRKREWLVPALQTKGCTVLNTSAPAESTAGIVTFHRADEDVAPLHQKLADAGVVASLRADRSGKKYIRLSPHFYNTDAELHRVLEML
jgi:selenocysteine lyase/cysteine desulfurase